MVPPPNGHFSAASIAAVVNGLTSSQSARQLTPLQQLGPTAEEWMRLRLQKVPAYSKGIVQTGHAAALRLRASVSSSMPGKPHASREQRRSFIGGPAFSDFSGIDSRLTELKNAGPFQARSECVTQAKHIVLDAHDLEPSGEGGTPVPALAGREVGMPSQWIKLMRSIARDPRFKEDAISTDEQLLKLYQTHGPMVLRGPQLDDASQNSEYVWHAIAVMAAVRVKLKTGEEHIALYAFDCNDLGQDPETSAAREKAEKLSKNMYELTFPEIVGLGSDKRRIRIIDGASMVASVNARRTEMSRRGAKSQFEALYINGGKPILDLPQTRQLEAAIAKHWSEVEMYPVPVLSDL